ncbi:MULTISPECIES: GNAT family N-acetyltransferase [unclassified Paenibacillus]|uniref:GNAT family N-acetyltransferase n=1 Tax=unclassified Paenibacillus TaxID=185978 RepID=UPI00119F281E|nr:MULTISPECIES: GNAT family N-acetyltransferase [unclassified Paenibacillus]MBJ9992785.1 GNAT family N-acetyltransferase [Paenibacillus sp. S28]
MYISKELADLMEQSEIDYMIDRMKAIQERPGNPMGIDIQTFGGAAAFYSQAMPWPQFNTVKGIGEQEAERLDEILEFYRKRQGRCQFEVVPSKSHPKLMKALFDQGYYQTGYHATLYGEPRSCETVREHITIRELAADEMDLYAEIHCLGTGLPISGKHHIADNNIVLYDRDGWKFYAGWVNGRPAGVGVMYIQDDTASLTFATTLAEYRNQGVQQALLEKRITEAHQSGCQIVVGQAAYASTSHRNMERAGLKLGYTRGTWVQA